MITALDHPGDKHTGFMIGPNQSMTWRGMMTIYAVIVFFSMTIAIAFYSIGLTLILPFSGVELLALGAALYVTAWRGGTREVIIIEEDRIIVETGRNAPEQRQEFQRHWSRVILERSWNHWYPSRLLIRSHGRQLEIGRFLNEQERQGLAKELQRALNATVYKINST